MLDIQYSIKQAIADDLKAMVALDKLCLGGIWSADAYLREIASPNSTILLLREVNGELNNGLYSEERTQKLIGLGCLWSIVEEAHITLLGIHPEYQRRGWGQLLLCSLLEDAVMRQLERATLEVKATNTAAINLYQKYGFQQAGRRKKYYPTGEDALILWLNGLDKPEFQRKLQQQKAKLIKGRSNEETGKTSR